MGELWVEPFVPVGCPTATFIHDAHLKFPNEIFIGAGACTYSFVLRLVRDGCLLTMAIAIDTAELAGLVVEAGFYGLPFFCSPAGTIPDLAIY